MCYNNKAMARRKKHRKSAGNNQKKPKIKIESEVKSSVFGVILVAVSIVVALAHLGRSSGWLSAGIVRFSESLFGRGDFLFPLILFVLALYILISKKPQVVGSTFLGGILIFLSILGAISLASEGGERLGGWVGFVAAWPFLKAVGFAGTVVFMAAFFISGILIVFRLPLTGYVREVLVPTGQDQEGKPTFGTQIVKEKGLLDTLSGAARKIRGPKLIPPRPADQTVTVNLPSAEAKQNLKEKEGGLRIAPASKDYTFPPIDLLEAESGSPLSGDIKANALIIQKTLEHFAIPVEMAEVNVGPSVTQFTLKPATGVKLSKLTVLQNDLALALAAHPVRIEAPIPGRSLVGIEIPNKRAMLVRLRSMFESFDPQSANHSLNIALGKDVAGRAVWTSLARMPHLLVAGATGAGKSVAIHAMLTAFLYQHAPEMLRIILIDPKRVELTLYNGVPHLLTPVVTDPKKATAAFKWAVSEMERRYELLSEEKVRDIEGYNARWKIQRDREFMPYLVIVIDELADLMAAYGREIEGSIVRLAQMARAVGIHLVVATQRPSVEVITGLIKANITSRVAFQVASQVDSRTILDAAGAEKLLGNGDMLFLSAESSKPKRIQGTYVAEKEVKRVVGFLRQQAKKIEGEETAPAALEGEKVSELEESLRSQRAATIDLERFSGPAEAEDELYGQASELVVRVQRASASMLQRYLRVGYARAARLLDMLEEQGIVGPQDGAKPREVLVAAPGPAPRRPGEAGEPTRPAGGPTPPEQSTREI